MTILKKSKRLKLTRKIENSNNEIATPCSYYKKQNRKYVINNKQSARCTKYIYYKLSYDVLINDWEQNVPRLSD